MSIRMAACYGSVVIALCSVACGGAPKRGIPKANATAKPKQDSSQESQVALLEQLPAEQRAKLLEHLSREATPASGSHDFSAFDGKMRGKTPGPTPTKASCQPLGDNEVNVCVAVFGYIAQSDGEAEMRCEMVDSTQVNVEGMLVKAMGDNAMPLRKSDFAVRSHAGGLLVSSTTDVFRDESFETLHYEIFFNRGYSVVCTDSTAGLRQTFAKVAHDFFASLQVSPRQHLPLQVEAGYIDWKKQEIVGFTLRSIADSDEGRLESVSHFAHDPNRIMAMGQSSTFTVRTPKGELIRQKFVQDQDGWTLRPQKGFYQVEQFGHKDNLITIPIRDVRIDSEFNLASSFAKIARGEQSSLLYAVASVDDNSAELSVVKLTRKSARELIETEGDSSDVLEIDDAGFVTKEISRDTVTERVYFFKN